MPISERKLPPIESIHNLQLDETLVAPPPLIEGLLEAGSKLMLVGSSKAHKSWMLLMMAMCLTTENARKWFKMPVHHCRVLYINFEIQKWFFRERLREIAKAMQVDLAENQWLDLWNLRGFSQDENTLVRTFKERLGESHGYQLIVVDPFYKLSGGGKVENVADQMAAVMRAVDEITVDLGAAVVFAHHSPKGDVSERSVVDRGAGSGVFGRDPDAIVSVMELKNDPGKFIAEFALRNHPPKEPLGLRWEFPFMRPDDDVKKPEKGRKSIHDRFKLSALLPEDGEPLSGNEWQRLALERLDISKTSYFRLRKKLVQDQEVECIGSDKFRRAAFTS